MWTGGSLGVNRFWTWEWHNFFWAGLLGELYLFAGFFFLYLFKAQVLFMGEILNTRLLTHYHDHKIVARKHSLQI